MKTIVFAKRNLLEILKDPLASVFFIILPTVLFIALKLIISSLGADIASVPQFEIKNLTAGMIIFSFSFITIFVGNNFAIDRDSSFLLRLKASSMKSYNFILGLHHTSTYYCLYSRSYNGNNWNNIRFKS